MKNKINSVKNLIEKFLFLENKNDLLTFKYCGVKIWQLYRINIFYDIAEQLNILDEYQIVKKSFTDRFKNIFGFIISIILHNPFFSLKKRNILIFDHCRKVKVDGEYIDVHTKYFIDKLTKDNSNFEVYESPFHNQHFTKHKKNRKHLDFILIFSRIICLFIFSYPNKKEKQFLKELSNKISRLFFIDYKLDYKMNKKAILFKAKYYLYKLLLMIKKPQKLYLVVSYYVYAPLIKAAKELKIETIELQHGMISKYHLGYHYPNSDYVDYFPNKIFLWSDFWVDRASFPIKRNCIKIKGFQYMEYQKEKYASYIKKNKNITVISQSTIGKKLANYILNNLKYLDQYNIFYKLDPAECFKKDEYLPIKELKKYSNFNLISDINVSIYELFAKSKFVIGVYSTAMVEAFEFGCDLIIINLPGSEYLDCFKEKENVHFLDYKDKVSEVL